jgi:membrane fusion protein, type I secretion system
MRTPDDIDGPPQWGEEPGSDGMGLQGAALILELQRLRHAFDNDNASRRARGPSRRNAQQQPRRRKPPKRAKKKGGMGKWLQQQFGLKPAIPAERRRNDAPAEITMPPRRESPALAPRDPLSMDLTKPPPEMPGLVHLHHSMRIDSPRLAPSRSPPAETTPARLVERARSGLMAGVNFIAQGDETPPPDASDGLMARARWAFDRELRMGLRILVVATILGGGWFALMPLAGAVVVPGNLVVQSNVKAIQHPSGGVVADIKVQNGMRVSAGDLLVRLDPTQAQASLQVISKQLDENRARIARLTAERDGLARIENPPALTARASDETVKSLLVSEASLFNARYTARQSQKDLLESRIAQLTEEISGFEAQSASKTKQLELITGELEGVQELYDKRLVPLARLTALQREAARIDGERGQLTSSIAETKSKIGEAKLQIVKLDQDFRTDVVKELGDVQGKENELVERGVAARDLLDRIEIRAPTSGVIHQLAAHTIGGVVRAGDTIMEIVPDTDDLQIEARLQPNDIDQVRTGQQAYVRFTAFNQRTTPQLTGSVAYVSADISHDQQTNASFFTVRVVLSEDERRRLAGQQLVPGMPAEVFMQTGSRTMMSYIFKPIVDQMRRAFVEQ